MKELIIHPQFVKVVANGVTFARASLLENGLWSVRAHPDAQRQTMTRTEAMERMMAASLLVALS